VDLRRPKNDVLNSVGRLYMLLGLLPVLLVIMIVRGDAPAWAYFWLLVAAVVLTLFTFVFLPGYQERVGRWRRKLSE
jgi:hypothetical protein